MQKILGREYKKTTQKSAFTLVEMSVVVVIIAIMLSTIIVSRMLITSAKVNAVYREILDFTSITTLFTNEYQCAPGDCLASLLPAKIIDNTPSGCFNLSTTTGMGNAASPGNSVATTTASTTQYIAAFGTGTIDSNAKRTCAFYQMQAFEPSGFGGGYSIAKKHGFNSILGVQNANAIGVGALKFVQQPTTQVVSPTVLANMNSLISNEASNTFDISGNGYTTLRGIPVYYYNTCYINNVYTPLCVYDSVIGGGVKTVSRNGNSLSFFRII